MPKSSLIKVACRGCFYWEPLKEIDHWGVCHRHAPTAEFTTAEVRTELVVTWPAVHAENWCGEGAQRG